MSTPFYTLPPDTNDDIENYARDLKRFLADDLEAGIFKARRVPRGVYEQRQDGTYMLRIRVSAGRLTSDQVRQIADLGRQYSDGRLHVTTRQDIQLHSVKIADTATIMRGLQKAGLSAKGGGGNTVRNITACPFSGVCPTEAFDVAPFAHALTEYMISIPGSFNLPRKYKIAFSGCAEDCSLARVNDLGLFPEVRHGQTGFRIYVGGGMGAKSRVGDLLEDWVPSTEIIRIAEAVRRIFDRLGDRQNRKRARLRFVLEKLGIDEFKKLYHDERITVQADGVPACNVQVAPQQSEAHALALPRVATEIRHGLRLIPENLDKRSYSVRLHLPLGYIDAAAFARLGDLAETLGDGVLRTTQTQDLLLTAVPEKNISDLGEAVQRLNLDTAQAGALAQFVACAGASTCRLGLCLSRGAAEAAAQALDAAGPSPEILTELRFNISGCPNACGQHPVAAVGFYGLAIRQNGKLLPAYRVLCGAKCYRDDTQLSTPVGTVPARWLPDFVLALARDFENLRGQDEPFACYAERQGNDHFARLLEPYSLIPEDLDDPELYRDWGQDSEFSLAGRGAGECGAGVFEVIAADIASAQNALEQNLEPWQILLPTIRALLITRGVDDRAPKALLDGFRQHFIQAGWIRDPGADLLARAEAFLDGDANALAGTSAEIGQLLDRVKQLYSTLDGNLQFHPPEAVAPSPQKSGGAADATDEIDLRGVACPMNFVKAKLKLETMPTGASLDILLDDGDPIRNVPASLRAEGHDIIAETAQSDKLWRIRVIKGTDA